jgi:hypothetical protein
MVEYELGPARDLFLARGLGRLARVCKMPLRFCVQSQLDEHRCAKLAPHSQGSHRAAQWLW